MPDATIDMFGTGVVLNTSGIISQPPAPGGGLIVNPQGGNFALTNCCGGTLIPTELTANVVVGSPFDCISESYNLFYLSEYNEWDAYDNCDNCKNTKIWISLKCTGGGVNSSTWTLTVNIMSGRRIKLHPTMTLISQNCNNFNLVFSGKLLGLVPITVTITQQTQSVGPTLPA